MHGILHYKVAYKGEELLLSDQRQIGPAQSYILKAD